MQKKNCHKHLILILLSTVIYIHTYAQDTLYLTKNQVCVTHDSIYYGKNDSIIILPASTVRIVTKKLGGSVDLLYNYYRSLIIDTQPPPPKQLDFTNSTEYFDAYNVGIIRSIRIIQVNTFTGHVEDTIRTRNLMLNWGHVNTHKRVIRRNLRFHIMDELSPSLMAENERLLRNLPYLEDARIFVRPDKVYIDSLDIVVVTQDKYPVGIDGSYSTIDKFTTRLFTKNFVGSGHSASTSMIYNSNGEPVIGVGGDYTLNNATGLFTQTSLNFENSYAKEWYRFNLSKPFLTNDTRVGGGIECYHISTNKVWNEYLTDTIIENQAHYSMNYYDGWFARSFFFRPNNFNQYFNSSIRITYNDYLTYPIVINDSIHLFDDNSLLLCMLSYNNTSYYKTNHIMGYGVTEDVPSGINLSLAYGIEFYSDRNRQYLGVNLSTYRYINKVGYFAFNAMVAGFKANLVLEDIKWVGQLYYFNQYKKYGQWGFRNLLSTSASAIKHPYNLTYEDFDNGIRHLDQSSIYGLSKVVLHYEPYIYTPLKYLGFNFAISLFTDLGWLSKNEAFKGKYNMYSSSGFGLHIKNESLAIPTLTFETCYFPVYNQKVDHFLFAVSFTDRELLNLKSRNKPQLYFAF